MKTRHIALLGLLAAVPPAGASEDLVLPPQITPAIRAACEQDVRRLCIDDSPTVEKVRRCVEQKFSQLRARCKLELTVAGLIR